MGRTAMGIQRLLIGAAVAAFLLIVLACESGPRGSATAVPQPTVSRTTHPSTPVAGTETPSTPTISTAPPAGSAAHPQLPETVTATSSGVPADPMVAADFPTPPDRDLLKLARQLRWNGVEPDPEPARFAGQSLAVGATTDFWTLDYPRDKMVSNRFVTGRSVRARLLVDRAGIEGGR